MPVLMPQYGKILVRYIGNRVPFGTQPQIYLCRLSLPFFLNWMNRWMNNWMNEWKNAYCQCIIRLHFPPFSFPLFPSLSFLFSLLSFNLSLFHFPLSTSVCCWLYRIGQNAMMEMRNPGLGGIYNTHSWTQERTKRHMERGFGWRSGVRVCKGLGERIGCVGLGRMWWSGRKTRGEH